MVWLVDPANDDASVEVEVQKQKLGNVSHYGEALAGGSLKALFIISNCIVCYKMTA